MDSHRSCDKPACGAPAAATLSYHYLSRTAWLDDLVDQKEPASHDLCAPHADGLRVPVGWAREDRRQRVVRSLFQPPIAS